MKQLTKIEQIIGKTITRAVESGEQRCLFFGEEYIVFEGCQGIVIIDCLNMLDKFYLGIITKEGYREYKDYKSGREG